MSSEPTEEVLTKSGGWWPYAAPLVVALVLFFLVGTLFETRIEEALRSFVERQRQRLFSQNNNQEQTNQTTTSSFNTPPPAKDLVNPVFTKYTPAQTIVSFSNHEPLPLNTEQIQTTLTFNKEFSLNENSNASDVIDFKNSQRVNFDVKGVERDNEILDIVRLDENNKGSFIMQSDIEMTPVHMRKTFDTNDEVNDNFSDISYSGGHLKSQQFFNLNNSEEFQRGKETTDLSNTEYRDRSEKEPPASNLYS